MLCAEARVVEPACEAPGARCACERVGERSFWQPHRWSTSWAGRASTQAATLAPSQRALTRPRVSVTCRHAVKRCLSHQRRADHAQRGRIARSNSSGATLLVAVTVPAARTLLLRPPFDTLIEHKHDLIASRCSIELSTVPTTNVTFQSRLKCVTGHCSKSARPLFCR